MLALVVAALVAVPQNGSNPELASRIHHLVDVAFANGEGAGSAAEVRGIFAEHGLPTIALVGAKRGKLAQNAQKVIVINSEHYGRVEDAHMGICHMICYAFIENPGLAA